MKNDILQWLSGLLDFFEVRLAKSNRSGGGGPGDKRVAGVREEGEERAGGGSSKKSGKQRGEAGGSREKLRNNTQYFAKYKG